MLILLFFGIALGRIHELDLVKDDRAIIDLSSFAYNNNGTLSLTFKEFRLEEDEIKKMIKDSDSKEKLEGTAQIGFILEKLNSRGAVKYARERGDPIGGSRCELHEKKEDAFRHVIKLDFYNPDKNDIVLTQEFEQPKDESNQINIENIKFKVRDNFVKHCNSDPDETGSRKRREDGDTEKSDEKSEVELDTTPAENDYCSFDKSVSKCTIRNTCIYHYNFSMEWNFGDTADGLYELSFHNCFNLKVEAKELEIKSLKMALAEENYVEGERHYLSDGDMPLPMVYGFCSILFFVATFIWLGVLRQQNQTVFRIHYLMLILVFVKAFSVMFHALNYRFLDLDGETDAWTIIFYVVHLLKGSILIITLTLIGSGWAFIKYVLADKEKKIFLLVVPLQVIVNIAFIILAEKEEGDADYTRWRQIMILLDLLCYAIILWPLYWSIKHLEQSSQTDGKAARNLEKLDLFRNFYIMFVLYIYFTRIVVYILRITLPPHLTWVDKLCDELATLVFFILTGYKFRPGCNNPYFKVEEEDLAEVVTKTAITEKVQKRKDKSGEKKALLAESDDDEDTILDTGNIGDTRA